MKSKSTKLKAQRRLGAATLLGVLLLCRIMRSPVLSVSANNPKNQSDHEPEKYAGNDPAQKEWKRDDEQQPARPHAHLTVTGKPGPRTILSFAGHPFPTPSAWAFGWWCPGLDKP